MKLYIDSSHSDKITVGLDEDKFETAAHHNKSQMLLPFVIEVLEKKNKTLKDITEITVVKEGPSTTGVRVGLAVANTIGWVLGIDV